MRDQLHPVRSGFDQFGFLINLLLVIPMGLAVLELTTSIFREVSLIPAFQMIVDGYSAVVGQLAETVEPSINAWLSELLGREIQLQAHSRHLFVLLVTAFLGYGRLVWRRARAKYPARTIGFLVTLGCIYLLIAAPISISIGLVEHETASSTLDHPPIGVAGVGIMLLMMTINFLEEIFFKGAPAEFKIFKSLGSLIWLFWPALWLGSIFPVAALLPESNHFILGGLMALVTLSLACLWSAIFYKYFSRQGDHEGANPAIALSLAVNFSAGFLIAAIIIMANMTIIHFTG